MYHLQGFMVINGLIDNSLNTVSPLGELSPQSRSYSREIGIYSDHEYDDVRLFTFYSVEDNKKKPLSDELAKHLLALGEWLSKESLLLKIDDSRASFIQKLNTEYLSRITVLQVGKMVTNGKYWLPEYITFQLNADTRKNRYKIWFADESFQNQYDKYEIEVIPAIVNVDDFHKGVEKVKQVLTEHTVENLHNRVNKVADEKPYTYILSRTYDYINPKDQSEHIPTSWTIIIYGEAGKNADTIRDALADWVLANSDFPRKDWEPLIPDMFIPTEFYLCPFWTKFATENLQLRGGIYSPTIPYRETIPYCQRTMFGYQEDHLKENVAVFDSIFKSIAVAACGHPKNRLLPKEFEKAWPDYCNIYTTSRDFNRISPETQEFILFMNKLFVEAETLTPDSEVLQEFTRVQRGTMYYLTGQFAGVTYLVPIRWNFLNEITNDQPSSIRLPTVNPEGGTTEEGDNRISDVIDLTPSIGTTPGYTRGRPIASGTAGSADGTGATTDIHKPSGTDNGLAGTPIDATDNTPAAAATASGPGHDAPTRRP